MSASGKFREKRPRLKLYIIVLLVMWTAAVIAAVVWNINQEKLHTMNLARIQAGIAYEKDIIYRRWNTLHGGVYAPVTEYTQPNPYLSSIPERDIITSNGKTMTLINPDYMMRQAYELSLEEFTVLSHITSLSPTREETAPDAWEKEALLALERGAKEPSAIQTIGGEDYMRLMFPVYTEEGCMQCHAKQVYQVGDIRGGLSVSVPMKPLRAVNRLRSLKFLSGISLMWLLGVGGILLLGRRLIKSDRGREEAEEQLVRKHDELQTTNLELDALNRVSTAINQTIDMNKLLDIVLHTITGLELFNIIRRGGIFIVRGEYMDLVSHLGHSPEFLDFHSNMKVGTCLCGLAAQTGEIIISKSSDDERHTYHYPHMEPHGHIIIPLKAMNTVTGVLYLYLPENVDIDEKKLTLLNAVGNQIGIAIENARLYEETKILSLRDPLTRLANRRLMEIMLDRSFARARRLKQPLSTIMLDIDHFKDYNDTYGHTAGDKMLIEVADILGKHTREIDLVARYGGEEFFVLLPETDPKRARDVAERIRKAVEDTCGITVSLGVSTFHDGMQKAYDLIFEADSALYRAKNSGRNRVEAGR